MIDVAWSLFTGTAWLFVLFWLIPYGIAKMRDHRNTGLILALSVIFSLWPLLWVSALGWIFLLVYAWATEPTYVYVPGPEGKQGPEGKPGRRGRDADEIPLSKSGVLRPRRR